MTYKELREKGLPMPTFKKLPSSDAANVSENIDTWIGDNPKYPDGKPAMVATFLRKDDNKRKMHKGFRFVCAEDFDEIITKRRTIAGVEYSVQFNRRIHTPDHFCPLFFRVWYDTVKFTFENETFVFQSISQLIKKTTAIRNKRKSV